MSLVDDLRAEFKGYVKDIYAGMHVAGSKLDTLTDILQYEDVAEFTDMSAVGNTDGGTDCEVVIGPAPQGTGWMVMRDSVSSGPGGVCAVYLDLVSPGNLIDFFPDASTWAQGPGNGIFVAAGRKLVFHFYNLGADVECTAVVQVKQFEATPQMIARLT